MANPFDFKDIAATIQRFSKETDAFNTGGAPAGQKATGFDSTSIGAPATIDVGPAGIGPEFGDAAALLKLSAGLSKVEESKDPTTAALKGMAKRAAEARAESSIADQAMSNIFGEPVAAAPAAPPDKFFDLPLDQKLSDVTASKSWTSLPYADKDEYLTLYQKNQRDAFARMLGDAGFKDKDLKEQLKRFDSTFTAKRPELLGAKPTFSITDSDWVDGITNMAQKLGAYGDYKAGGSAVAYSEAAKAADDSFQSKKSALTLDEEKASARRNYLQQVANAKADPSNTDLTLAQETSNAWDDFRAAPVRTALSSTGLSMIAGPLAATGGRIVGALGGGALGTLALPGAGTVAGAAAGQHLLGTAAAAAVEVPFTAQDAMDGALANIRDTPDAELIKSPMMQAEMKANGGDFARAKGALMEHVAREADTRGQLVGGASALADMYLGSGKLAGKAAEAMGSTALGMSKKGIINSIRQSIGLAPVDDAISRVAADLGTKGTKGVARTVGALGVDAAKEAVVEGTTQYQSNQAVASAGLNINPWEGVASSATMGAIIGPAVGGTTQLGTKALDVVGQKYTGFGSQGVKLKDGEYVIGVDGKTGDLTRIRRARDADLANFAADPSTGLMRQIDTESSTPGRTRGADELISEGMLAYNNNRRVLGAAAMDSLQGDPNAPLVANLFGHMVAATQYGPAADVARSNPTALKGTDENVQFIFNGNGTVNYRGVDGAPVSESAQQEANALIAQAQSLYSTPLRESVSTFFGRTAAPAVAPTNPGGNMVDAGVADGYLQSAPTPTASPAPFAGMNPGQGGLTTQVASSMLTRANISGVNTTDLAAFLDEHNWLNDPKSAEGFNTALSAPASAVQGRGATAVRDLVRAYNANPNAVLAALPAELKPAVQAIAETAPIEDAAFAANVARAPAGGPSANDASTSNASAEGALTAPSLRAPRGKTTPPEQARIAVMDALTELSSGRSPYASPSQRRLAQALKQIFQTSNIPVPETALAQLASGVAGDYTPNKHAVRIRTDAAASTFIHELLHAATFRGLERMNELAREGNRKAARTAALIEHIHTAAKQAAQGAGVGNPGNPGAFYALFTYKNMTGAEQYAEMFAELGNPAFIQLLQSVPFESTNPTPELRSIFAELHANTNGTLFDALVSAIRALLRYVSVRNAHAISEATLAEALLTATHEAVSLADQAYGGTSPTVATNPRTAPAEEATEPATTASTPAAQEAARVDNSSMETLIPEARRSEAPVPTGGSVGAIREALVANYGDLANTLESKGLLSLVETEAEAVELLVRDLVQAQGVTEAEARETVNRQLRIGSTELGVRAARGGVIEGFFHPATGKSYLVASALTPESAGATLMHEVGVHAASDGSLNPLFARASELLMQPSEDPILREAARRWNAAGETSGEEAMAYIVTAYETNRNVASPTVAQFIQDLIAAIRAWANRTLGISIAPTPADLAAIARANARGIARGAAVEGGAVYSRGAAAPLPGYDVSPAVGAAYGPDPELNRVADDYAASAGIPIIRQREYVRVDPVKAERIAEAYEAMLNAPDDPAVAASYQALSRETRAQYDALTKAGYSFYFVDPDSAEGRAYVASPWTALRELRTAKRMGVYPTAAGYGSDSSPSGENPMLADTGLRWSTPSGAPAPVLVNDLFRAVHDAFSHGLEGAGFRARGEENTWRAHAGMFSDEALGALTTETRGQNSWLNFGPSGRENQTALTQDTTFAPQKIGLMPAWTWADARHDAADTPGASPLFSRTTAATDAALAGAPATPVRGPSFLNAARTRNPLEAKSKWNALRQRFKAAFVTHLAPVEEAIDAIPDRLNARREQLMADLWLAPNRRDWAKQEAEHRFGGADMTRILGGMANRTKANAETVLRDVGFYHTARYVQIKMAEMTKADQAAAASAARALADAQARNAPRATILKLTNELRAAEKLRDDRAYAYAQGKVGQQEHFGAGGVAAQRALENAEAALAANPNDVAAQKAVDKARATLNSHRVGIPAGMPKAEAEDFIRKMGAKYGVAELEKASKAMNRLMGFRLALDLMSGRTTVGAASAFAPELQALTAQMQAVVNASRAVSTTNPSTRAVLDRALDDFVTRYAAASKYVPTTGAVNEEEEALDVFGQGVRAPNVATDRRLEGRSKGRADSGINAGMAALYRSASDYGWLPFKQGIAALYNEATPAERAALGMNTPVDITVLQRLGDNIIIHDGKGYTFGGDGVMQAIRGENIDGTSDVVKALAAPTFFLAKAMTQWDPTFGPRNAVRDLWERTENVRARKLTDVNGKAVDPNKVANRALRIGANPKFYKEIAAFISGDGRTASSDTARWLKEAMAAGFGGARRLEMLGTDRKTLVEAIEGSNSDVRKGMTALSHVVHQWNTAFDSVAPLAIYIAMREAGVSEKQAAYKTLDLMNFRKQGSAMGFVRVLYAFAQPAVTGGHQLIRSASTREGMVRIAAYTVAFAVIKALLAGIAGDDDDLDRKKTDLLDEFTKDRVLAIPMPGGGIAKMPIGYGFPMLGNAIAQIGRESPLGLGDKSWTDTAEQFITRALLPQISPIEDSKISTSDSPSGAMVQTFAPTMFAPIIDVAINRSGFGKEITREEFEDPNRPKSAQGSPFTAGFYQDAAKLIYNLSGGALDYAPEQVRTIIQGYSPGALGMARKATIDNPNATASGRGVTTPLVDRFYIGDNPNKVMGEIGAFQERGERLLKSISKDLPEDVARGDVVDAVREQLGSVESPSDRATLSLYLDYQDMLEDFKGEARALTTSGTPKDPTDPDRAALSLSRNQAQIEVLNRWYQIKGE